MEVPNIDKVEMCWGILRPKQPEHCEIKEYLVGSFYCPPNSRKKEKLITHIITNTHILLTKYPNCGLFIGGDKNSLNIAPILLGLPKCWQVVTENTHNDKCLDILITNIHTLYQPIVIVEAVIPDDPRKIKPSDHLVPISYPITGQSGSVPRKYQTKVSQPLPLSGIREFGDWLAHEDWESLDMLDGPNQKLDKFSEYCSLKIKDIFLEKSVKMSNEDLPFINWKLKGMKRKVQRLYRMRDRREDDYIKALSEYNSEFQKTAKEYVRQNVSELESVNPAKAASILKRLGGAPGDCEDAGQFTVLSHQSQNLSPEESTAQILKYFTDISKEFEPLDVSTLPVRVKVKLLDRATNVPQIEDYQVFNNIKSTKKPRSKGVPGDLPKKILIEFPVELAAPVGKIFRSIMKTNIWPSKWTIEHGIVLKKTPVLETESDLRIISLSLFWSKCMESFVIDWLHQTIGHKIDFTQYGGLKGNSTSHYLIDLVNFILFNQDLRNPQATLAIM